MLERRVLVAALVGEAERAMQGLLETFREGGQRLLLFHGALQGMTVLAGHVHDLRHLGLRDLIGVDAADADALVVNMQHDAGRLFPALAEEPLQNEHHELHRRVVVVQDQHLVEARLLGLRLGLRDDIGLAVVMLGTAATPYRPASGRPSSRPFPSSSHSSIRSLCPAPGGPRAR